MFLLSLSTKPTNNYGDPSGVNGYQSVTLADGSIAVVWRAATLKTVNGDTDGIQDVYARIIDPITGQFVTDEINITNAQQTQDFWNPNATSGAAL